MVDFNDSPLEVQNALEIWADIMFGDHTVRPEIDEQYLTEKPAQAVLAADEHRPYIPVWVHEAFSELVIQDSRREFERGPTKKEIPDRPAQKDSPAPGTLPRIDGKRLREAMRRKKETEPVRQVDGSLQIHFTVNVKDEIFEIRRRLHDADSMFDPEYESDLEFFDEVVYFTLTRTSDNVDPHYPEAWRVRRFKPSDLFNRLQSVDQDKFRVVTLIEPLQ